MHILSVKLHVINKAALKLYCGFFPSEIEYVRKDGSCFYLMTSLHDILFIVYQINLIKIKCFSIMWLKSFYSVAESDSFKGMCIIKYIYFCFFLHYKLFWNRTLFKVYICNRFLFYVKYYLSLNFPYNRR